MTVKEFKTLKVGDVVIVNTTVKDGYGEIWHHPGEEVTIKKFTPDRKGVIFEWSDLGVHYKFLSIIPVPNKYVKTFTQQQSGGLFKVGFTVGVQTFFLHMGSDGLRNKQEALWHKRMLNVAFEGMLKPLKTELEQLKEEIKDKALEKKFHD